VPEAPPGNKNRRLAVCVCVCVAGVFFHVVYPNTLFPFARPATALPQTVYCCRVIYVRRKGVLLGGIRFAVNDGIRGSNNGKDDDNKLSGSQLGRPECLRGR